MSSEFPFSIGADHLTDAAIHDEIKRRAYRLYQQHGIVNGHLPVAACLQENSICAEVKVPASVWVLQHRVNDDWWNTQARGHIPVTSITASIPPLGLNLN